MKIAIIGAGAAGLMAAATCTEHNPRAEVFLFEKNDVLGKKVTISGGGRCNVTTGLTDPKEILSKYPRGKNFLISSFAAFSPDDVRTWFEAHGVPLKCEKDNRVFPLSDRGESIVECFEKLFADHRVTILRQHTVQKIEKNDEKFIVYSKNSPAMVVDKVIITLGGQAYRHTGSTGDGYSLAEALGHTITPLAPSLHSFITKEKWLKKLAGVAFPILGLSAGVKKRQSIVGPALCTHSGITGPAVFALSSLTAFEAFDTNNPLSITIDFVPEFSYEALLKKITDLIEAHPKKDFKNTLHHFVPHSVAETLCEIGGLDGDRNNAEISNAQKEKAADVLKKTIIEAIGRGAGDEFVTAGGIALSEVDPKTMESKICPGLFFAGEILDIDGFTGGFNLQAAWATGHVAGKNACNKEKGSLN